MIKTFSKSAFARYMWTAVGMFVAVVIYVVSYALLQKKIDDAKGVRYQSMLLLSEYRQSIDEQRRMALTYIATGNPVYKAQYQNILDIRNGLKPRSERDNTPYLGLPIKEKISPETPIPLLELIRQDGFSKQEYLKL